MRGTHDFSLDGLHSFATTFSQSRTVACLCISGLFDKRNVSRGKSEKGQKTKETIDSIVLQM